MLIKAVAGGGGKGMRRVDKHADFDAALESAQREAAVVVRRRARADREIRHRAAPHRDPGVRRHARQRDPSQRARLLAAAPPPEGDRGSAGARHDRRGARRDGRGRGRGRARRSAMSGAGTVEFIADGAQRAAARRLLVHGNEHAAAGRASGDRGDHRARSGRMAVPRRGRRDAAADAGRRAARRPRGRGAALCRGSRARLPAVDRQARGAGISAGRGHPRRYRRRGGRRGLAVLRSDDRQGDRAWRATANEALDRLAGALERTVVAGPRTNLAFLAALCRASGVSRRAFRHRLHRPQSRRARRASIRRPRPAPSAARGRGAAARRDARSRASRLARSVGRDRRLPAVRPRAARSRHHGRRRAAQGDVSHGATARRSTVDGVAAARRRARSCRRAAASLCCGSGRAAPSSRCKSFDAIDVDHLDGDGVVQGADARQGAGAPGRAGRERARRASASPWSRR